MSQWDYGGGFDVVVVCWGGMCGDWFDLLMGINLVLYLVGIVLDVVWNGLLDSGVMEWLLDSVCVFWQVFDYLDILVVNGVLVLIVCML